MIWTKNLFLWEKCVEDLCQGEHRTQKTPVNPKIWESIKHWGWEEYKIYHIKWCTGSEVCKYGSGELFQGKPIENLKRKKDLEILWRENRKEETPNHIKHSKFLRITTTYKRYVLGEAPTLWYWVNNKSWLKKHSSR